MPSGLLTISQAELWKTEPTTAIRFRKEFSPVPRIEYGIIANRLESSDINLFIEKSLWEIIWHLDADAAKLHLWLCVHASRQKKPWEAEFKLLGSDLVKALGWDQKKDRNREEQLRRVNHYAWLLSNITVKVIHNEGQKNSATDFSKLWNIPLIREYGESNHEGKIDDLKEVSLVIWMGGWVEHFANKEALQKRGWAGQKLLNLDSQKDELAIRLGIYSLLDDRTNTKYKYQLEDLLQTVLPKVHLVKAFSHNTAIHNFKQRVYQAFDDLVELGWQVRGLEYKANVDDLLASVISLKPPTPTPDKSGEPLTTPVADDSIKLRQPPKISLTKEQIRQFRLRQGWTQTEMAEYMGISQELVSKIERGDRGINEKVEEMFRKAIDTATQSSAASSQASV